MSNTAITLVRKSEPKTRFKCGEVVGLASGGFPMTVRKCSAKDVTAYWHLADGSPAEEPLPLDMVKPVEVNIEVGLDEAEEVE